MVERWDFRFQPWSMNSVSGMKKLKNLSFIHGGKTIFTRTYESRLDRPLFIECCDVTGPVFIEEHDVTGLTG